MGLIARFLEARGITTLCLTSAWSITALVNPPRAAFLDFPLGHAAGRPQQQVEQLAILSDALPLLETIDQSGEIVPLPYAWGTPWKNLDLDADVDWPLRLRTPQYQSGSDQAAAVNNHGVAALALAS